MAAVIYALDAARKRIQFDPDSADVSKWSKKEAVLFSFNDLYLFRGHWFHHSGKLKLFGTSNRPDYAICITDEQAADWFLADDIPLPPELAHFLPAAEPTAAPESARAQSKQIAKDATTQRVAGDLWRTSPITVFETARDAASDAVDITAALIQLAQQYREKDRTTTLSAICRDHKTVGGEDYVVLLLNAIQRFQTLSDETPIKRFLDQDTPVSLESLRPDAKGRWAASSYHDLAVALACQLIESIKRDLSVVDYLNALRYATAAGDWIPDHIAKIKSHVACESVAAIREWEKHESMTNSMPNEDPFPELRAEQKRRQELEMKQTDEWQRRRRILAAIDDMRKFNSAEFELMRGRPARDDNEFCAAWAPRIVNLAKTLEAEDLWNRVERLALEDLPAEAKAALTVLIRARTANASEVVELLLEAKKLDKQGSSRRGCAMT